MIRVVHPGSRIRILSFYPSRIPDPVVKKAPDPGSGSLTLFFSVGNWVFLIVFLVTDRWHASLAALSLADGFFLKINDWPLASYHLIDIRFVLISPLVADRFLIYGNICVCWKSAELITCCFWINFCVLLIFFIPAGVHSGGRELTEILCSSRQECRDFKQSTHRHQVT